MASQLSTGLRPPVSAHDHVRGSRSAIVSLVEYGDFECPYCRAALDIVNGLQHALGDQLNFTFRHFPMREVHPHAQHAAEVAEAAATQGHFWEMHDRLFAAQDALNDRSLIQYVRELDLDAEVLAEELTSCTYAAHIEEQRQRGLMTSTIDSTVTAPTRFIDMANAKYAYRRFGGYRASALPLLCLQHFTGTLDNWDPAVTDPLASTREVILFDNAGIGRSTGTVPETVAGMATHALAFLDGLGIDTCDVLGYSLGGMVAQQMALNRPSIFRRMILVGTAPRGGEDIMHLEKPSLARYLNDPGLQGYAVLQKIFFAPTAPSQAAGKAFVSRLVLRTEDRDRVSGPEVARAQLAAFREWEQFTGERFADLQHIGQPTLVVNGVYDEMIPVRNSYWLAEHLPNAVLLTYPDSGHGSLFQWHDSFQAHASRFLAQDGPFAPY
jgi:pimeloyl-ACP methyl ester carboxylesterase